METGLIPEHHHMHVGIDFAFKLLEEKIDDLRVQIRRQQANALAGRRTRGTEHIEIVVTGLSDRRRTRTTPSPLAG